MIGARGRRKEEREGRRRGEGGRKGREKGRGKEETEGGEERKGRRWGSEMFSPKFILHSQYLPREPQATEFMG